MVAYNTPWIIYDPVDTTNEPSSCLLPRGMRREVSHKVYEEENMRRTYKEERNLEDQNKSSCCVSLESKTCGFRGVQEISDKEDTEVTLMGCTSVTSSVFSSK
ncbi:hypothetical protein YC2023_050213 [Brassica napus]